MNVTSRRLFACVLVLLIAGLATVPGTTAPPGASAPEADFFMFDGTVAPGNFAATPIPDGKMLVVTDIVLQNVSTSIGPVLDSQYSGIFFRAEPDDAILHAVGNETVNLHFSTGLRVKANNFQISNGGASSAPEVAYIVSGYLTKRPPGF